MEIEKLKEVTRLAFESVKDLPEDNGYKIEGYKIVLSSLLNGRATASVVDNDIQNPIVSQNSADWQKKISSTMDLTVQQVGEIYHMNDEGTLELLVESKDLPNTTSKSAQHLAALICAGRQAAGIEKSTSLDEVRKVCEHYKVYDSKNFSSSMKQLGSKYRFSGSNSTRAVELTNGAFKLASDVAKNYAGQQ